MDFIPLVCFPEQDLHILVALMATRTQILNQDIGFGLPFSGKVSIAKKIEGSMKPRRPLQQLNCKNLENLPSKKGLDTVAAKPVAADKPNQEKVKKNGGRRALGDLTNSSKLLQNSSLKLPYVAEKGVVVRVPDPAQEGSFHDHRECNKAQRYTAMDIDYFLETVGLRKDCSTPIVSPKLPPSTTSKLESPMRLEFECYGSLSPTASPPLLSPVRHLDHEVDMLQLGMEWDSLDLCGFKMESPSK